jgi:O-antigen ligase
VKKRLESSLEQVLALGLIATTLLVTPLFSLDPINPIKMLVVCLVGFMCLGLILVNRADVDWRKYRVAIGLVISFNIWMILVLLISPGEIYQQIFGSTGRNTGLITYVSFSLILLGSLIASSMNALKRLIHVIFIVGSASLAYGIVQALGGDPFEWVNPYSPVFGFLGNPNFQSSLLGVLGAIAFAQLFTEGLKAHLKIFVGLYLVMTLYVIGETHSQQGFLVLSIGISVILGLYVLQRNRRLGIGYGFFLVLSFFLVLFGSLDKGPLGSILYKASVTYRGDYWLAGWTMMINHPIFGVGMDSYGDWYRRSRTMTATLRRGPDITSNAAHNVFLDIAASGGVPLLLIYLALMILVIVSALKILKRQSRFNPFFAGLFGGWVAFQAQSIISINQIGLAVWGWVISGLIIGYEINTRSTGVVAPTPKTGRVARNSAQSSARSVISIFIAFLLGLLVGIPPYVASVKFKSALESSNPQVVQEAAYLWPPDPSRMARVALSLNEYPELEANGLKVAVDAVAQFPDYYYAWATLGVMNLANAEQKAQALAQMKRLDPNNRDLK